MLELALSNHPGFPHFTNLHRCTYAVDIRLMCIITATNLAFSIIWNKVMYMHVGNLMAPFLRRAMAEGVIRYHSARYITSTLCAPSGNSEFNNHRVARTLLVQGPARFRVTGPQALVPRVWQGTTGKRGGNRGGLAMKLVNYCAERDQRGYHPEHPIIEPSYPPLDLASSLTLAPHVDHLEISGGFERPRGYLGFRVCIWIDVA